LRDNPYGAICIAEGSNHESLFGMKLADSQSILGDETATDKCYRSLTRIAVVVRGLLKSIAAA
jgi:hypothetical protein